MGDVAASGGYYISMAADAIVAQPGTITGSIGVLSGKPVTSSPLERVGITTDSVTVSCNDANDLPLEGACRPVPPGDLVVVQSERAIDWDSTTSPAKFECGFRNNDSVQHNTQARIVCVNVP